MHNAFLPPLVLPLLFTGTTSSPTEEPLSRSILSGTLAISGQCLGGHTAECLVVELTNRTDRPIRTTIPAGWLMQNADPEAQDLMIVDHRTIELAPHATQRVNCKAYCVESSDSSPQAGVQLYSKGLAQPTWVKLAEHLVKNNVDEDDVQAAVWAVANDHDIAAIGADDVQKNRPLRKFVAELTGRKVPWYGKNYAPPTQEGRVFSDAPTSVHGEIDFALNTNGVVTVLVHDATGRLMHTIGKDRYLGPGQYGMEVDLTVQGWPKGEYTIQFFLDGSRLLKRLEFDV
ncbi:MAG TPA: hypothetical protein PLB89_09395 [Flavobacteriales bacterium]|nr:hypothetical protein [Flavobacteriales bacterium]